MLATGPPWPSGGRQPRRSSAGMQKHEGERLPVPVLHPSCLYLRTWELQSPWVMLIGSMMTFVAPSFFQICSMYLAVSGC